MTEQYSAEELERLDQVPEHLFNRLRELLGPGQPFSFVLILQTSKAAHIFSAPDTIDTRKTLKRTLTALAEGPDLTRTVTRRQ